MGRHNQLDVGSTHWLKEGPQTCLGNTQTNFDFVLRLQAGGAESFCLALIALFLTTLFQQHAWQYPRLESPSLLTAAGEG